MERMKERKGKVTYDSTSVSGNLPWSGVPSAFEWRTAKLRQNWAQSLLLIKDLLLTHEEDSLCNREVLSSRRGFTFRLKRLKPTAPNFGGPQNFRSKDDFQHFCKQLYLYFCFGSTHVFYYAANKRSVLNRGFQMFSSEGHISYYTKVRGSDILRNVIVSGYVTFYQVKKLLSINFSLFTKCIRGTDLARSP